MMPGYSSYHPVLAIVALAAIAADRPAPSAIRAEPIARAARHPGPLLVREESNRAMAGTYGTPVWVASVSAADGSFAPMSILLLESGSALAASLAKGGAAPQDYEAELRRRADDPNQPEALRQLDRLRGQGGLVRPVPLANGRSGYAAVLGFGPDRTRVSTLLPSPDARYELVIIVDVPFQRAGAAMPPELGRYRTRLAGELLESVQEMAMSVYRQLFPPQRKQATWMWSQFWLR
jgi:hypothetical protein